MRTIRNREDFLAGLLFIAFGVAALVFSRSYPVGDAARMGPGYFPRLLGIVLVVLGTALSLRGFRAQGDAVSAWRWQPLIIILVGVGVFGLVAKWLGLIVAAAVLVVISSFAHSEFNWKEALVSGGIQGVAAVVLFVYGLGLPLPVWPVLFAGGR